MKSTTLFQAGCGVLACLAVESAALPSPGGGGHNRVRPRHSTTGDATKTVLLTVSVGPSTTVTIPPCTDEGTTTSTSAIVSTLTFVTEVTTTILPTATDSAVLSSSLPPTSSLDTSSTPTPTPTSTESIPTSTSSSTAPPAPTESLGPEVNPITAPATQGNAILAQNAADAQAMNRMFRGLKLKDACEADTEACIGDVPVRCLAGTWGASFCSTANTKCRAVPRMQTNGVALGCFTDGDVQARISSTGQPGNAFGE